MLDSPFKLMKKIIGYYIVFRILKNIRKTKGTLIYDTSEDDLYVHTGLRWKIIK